MANSTSAFLHRRFKGGVFIIAVSVAIAFAVATLPAPPNPSLQSGLT